MTTADLAAAVEGPAPPPPAGDAASAHTSPSPDSEGGMKPFFQAKFKREAQRNWDIFYRNNTTNFFKDRHWTGREFVELLPDGQVRTLLEIGCGVGNFLFPLLQANPHLYIHACDFSSKAIAFVHAAPAYDATRLNAFVADITCQPLSPPAGPEEEAKAGAPTAARDAEEEAAACSLQGQGAATPAYTPSVPPTSVDLVAAIFVLSAIPPEKMSYVLANIKRTMRPGAIFIFRDYGVGDAAQVRFKPTSRVSENLYVRGDGTLSYFFSKEFLASLFAEVGGFTCLENEYYRKQVVNRKKELTMNRVWLQSKFQLLA